MCIYIYTPSIITLNIIHIYIFLCTFVNFDSLPARFRQLTMRPHPRVAPENSKGIAAATVDPQLDG